MNILLIVCDTLRADHLGCYGYFRDTSPNIDNIARDGVVYEDFYNAGCPTGPGFTCIYTGLHTIHHKYYQFGHPNIRQVDDTIFTMAEVMRAIGYTTAAFDNLMNVIHGRAKHFVRGYEFYVNCAPTAFDLAHHLKADELNHRLLPWIDDYSNEDFFLFVHYWDPHGPYNQPKKYRNIFQHESDLSDLEVANAPAGYRYVPGWGTVERITEDEKPLYYGLRAPNIGALVDLYDGEIAYCDRAIGDVIEKLEAEGVLEETLIVVTSDHGEQLCQHKSYGWQHAGLHDACTHIPLIMRYPRKLPKGLRINGFCQQIDILPTIMDLIGMETSILEIDGKSSLPILKGEKTRNEIFMEHTSGQRSVRTDEWHLLDDETVDIESAGKQRRQLELYNVKEDPMEIINLGEVEVEIAQELRNTLREWVQSNLEDGETDPAIYEDWRELDTINRDYGRKIKEFLASLETGEGPS